MSDSLSDVYVLVAQSQFAVRVVIDAYDTDGDGLSDGVDPDDDNDGQLDVNDACPTRATSWLTPIGDNDCDGFTLAIENFVGTDGGLACATTPAAKDEPSPDAWPVDFNDDQKANLSDVLKYSSVFNSTGPGAPYDLRFDLTGDNHINLSDVLKFSPFFNQSCAP